MRSKSAVTTQYASFLPQLSKGWRWQVLLRLQPVLRWWQVTMLATAAFLVAVLLWGAFQSDAAHQQRVLEQQQLLMNAAQPDAGTIAAGGIPQCPFPYARHSMQELQQGTTPYLFGGRRQPECRHCDEDHLWSNFCQYKSHGQLCNPRDSAWLIKTLVERNWTQLLALTPCDFWPFIAGKTVWIMGDSQGLDLYKAMKCFFFEFWPLDSEGPANLDNRTLEALSRSLPPMCVPMPEGTQLCYIRADRGDYAVEEVLPRLIKFASRQDVLLINFGLHHGEHIGYGGNLTLFTEFVARHHRSLPRLIWHPTPPQHFLGWQGEYPGGKPPFDCVSLNVTLLADGTLQAETEEMKLIEQGGWRNALVAEMFGSRIPIAPSYNESVPLYYYHRDNGAGYECTHYCFPSAQQTWVYGFYRALFRLYTGHDVHPTESFDGTTALLQSWSALAGSRDAADRHRRRQKWKVAKLRK